MNSFRLEVGDSTWSFEELARTGGDLVRATGIGLPTLLEPVALDVSDRPLTVRAFLGLRSLGAAIVPMQEGLDAAERTRRLALAGVRHDLQRGPGPSGLTLQSGPGQGRPLPAEYVVFTSGSEGPAKAALLSEDGLRRHATLCAGRLGSNAKSRWLMSLSPAHVGGLALLTRALEQGSTVVVPRERPPQDLDATVEAHRISHLSLVPTQLRRWLRARARTPAPSSLRCVLVGGAHCPPDLVVAAREAGFPVRTTYGLTEASSQVATADLDSPPDSVGPPLPGVDVRIVDERGEPTSGTGRILVRSPALFRGYLQAGGTLHDAVGDGWFLTEDRGRLGARGVLHVEGRIGRVVNTGGHKVDPARVEAVLASHPSVDEAVVLSRPDEDLGQCLEAVVVAAGHLDEAELRRWCRDRLARHEQPKGLRFVDQLPRLASGKVDQARLA